MLAKTLLNRRYKAAFGDYESRFLNGPRRTAPWLSHDPRSTWHTSAPLTNAQNRLLRAPTAVRKIAHGRDKRLARTADHSGRDQILNSRLLYR